MKLHTILDVLGKKSVKLDGNLEITSIEIDSRLVQKGSLFVCIEGFTVDGHKFIDKAIENGAVAIVAHKPISAHVPVIQVSDTSRAVSILANAFYEYPTSKFPLIGITGTNGKTSTANMIEQILQFAGKCTGIIGTVGMKIKDEFFEVKNTTPDIITLQKIFKKMNDEKIDGAVMEVSSHALHQGRIHGCEFDIAVFTNLTQDHLDYHETMEEYQKAKSLLFSQLGNSYRQAKYAILNNDEKASKEFKIQTQANVISYGIDNNSDVLAKNITMSSKGTKFTLVISENSYDISMKLIGKFNVYNVLAAISACIAYGISERVIVDAISSLSGVAGRFELVEAGQDYTVIVDYAHTPDGLENVLRTVKEIAKGKIYSVCGCGGDRDKTKRPQMAKISTKYADLSIFTSDNPRSEKPESILADMIYGLDDNSFKCIVNRKEAIEYAVSNAVAGDVVIIAGKGHETYQIIGSEVLEFDDRLIAKKAIINS